MVRDGCGASGFPSYQPPFPKRESLAWLLGIEPVWFDPSQSPALSGRKAEMSQKGWLTKEGRKRGRSWVYHWYKTRPGDGKHVENTAVVGRVANFPKESSAWVEVER